MIGSNLKEVPVMECMETVAGGHGWRPQLRRSQGRPPSKSDRLRAGRFGDEAERHVGLFLRSGGYHILGRRVRVGAREIDLIVIREGSLAFVEVKARARRTSSIHAVTPRKQRLLTEAAYGWLQKNPEFFSCSWRFDVALVSNGTEIEYLENAFEPTSGDGFVF